MRLDVYLVRSGLLKSRAQAQEMIEAGQVLCDGVCVKKSSFALREEHLPKIELLGEVLPFVSRGGLKLQEALNAFGINVTGLTAVDIGASTGGFTDCLLQRGAKKVYCIDCGTDQLHPSLRTDARVVVKEQYNARFLTAEELGEFCDLAVMDVSFISQSLLFPAVCRVLRPGGRLVALIKPQFEAGRKALSKKGIVKEEKDRLRVIENLRESALIYGLEMGQVIVSPVLGGDGNTEYLTVYTYTPQTKE